MQCNTHMARMRLTLLCSFDASQYMIACRRVQGRSVSSTARRLLGDGSLSSQQHVGISAGTMELSSFVLPATSPCVLRDRQLLYVNGRCVRSLQLMRLLDEWFRHGCRQMMRNPDDRELLLDKHYQQARCSIVHLSYPKYFCSSNVCELYARVLGVLSCTAVRAP